MSDERKFIVEVKDYEAARDPDPLTTDRVERVVTRMLEKDGSDGYVVVTEESA